MAVCIIPYTEAKQYTRKNLLTSMAILDKYISFDYFVLSRRIGTLLQKVLVYYKYQEMACVCVSGKVLW